MEFGVCNLSIIPLREKPSHKSEMVSQILFGESYSIIQNFEDWIQIKLDQDHYSGWINLNQHNELTAKQHKKLQNTAYSISIELMHTLANNDSYIPVLIGSKLYEFDGLNCNLNGQRFTFNGLALDPQTYEWKEKSIIKTAKKYLNTPYLWGGRSPFGIDCSGLVQNLFLLFNIRLPRDSNQQAKEGILVNFVKEAKTGDLAFFSNEEGFIDHVGMLLGNDHIIHASGKVRIDKIDHFGIFDESKRKYSHKLRIIKRIM